MLSMIGVGKVYRTGLLLSHALRDVNLEIGTGEFVALMGPSGSGKTTLLNIAGLLEENEQGSYRLDGADVSALGDTERSRLRNRKIGFVFQSFNLIPDLTVSENIEVPLRYRGLPAPARTQRVRAVLDQVGLGSRADHLPALLSGGQQQRVAIARALAGEPQLLLADEPTGNLDSLAARDVLRLLEEVNGRGTTVVMATHDAELARRAHRCVHLLDGQVSELTHTPFAAARRVATAG